MRSLNEAVTQNPLVAKWFNMLNETEKHSLIPIFNHVLNTTEFFNELFHGFEVYVTGSSLNLVERSYNDIDIMVVLSKEELRKAKVNELTKLWELFKKKDLKSLSQLLNDKKIKILGITDPLNSIIDALEYSNEISNENKDGLYSRTGSTSEVTRLLMDPGSELAAIKVRVEGMLEAEKNNPLVEADGTSGFEYGTLVEEFLNNVATTLGTPAPDGQCSFYFQWHKSFSEGYGKTAGENNCHIYPRVQCTPVHLFLTTGVDQKKAMEKKESFMLEYYTTQERLPPVKIF